MAETSAPDTDGVIVAEGTMNRSREGNYHWDSPPRYASTTMWTSPLGVSSGNRSKTISLTSCSLVAYWDRSPSDEMCRGRCGGGIGTGVASYEKK